MNRFCCFHLVRFTVAFFTFLSAATAQITLSQNFDSGSLDVADSTVNGTVVHLAGRETWTDISWDDYYRWVYFRASGVQDVTPEFRIDERFFLGSLQGHRYVYSYDQTNWQFFEQGAVVDEEYIFSNSSPFIHDEVYVAYGLPYPVSRTAQQVSGYQGNPYVVPTISASPGFVIGQSPGGNDELGRSIPPSDLYAFKITDPSSVGTKTKVLLATGSHAGETAANFGLEGFLDFLTGPSLIASQLRGVAEFYVYPQINPDGRYAGYYRSSVEHPDKDYNRFFDDPTGISDLSQITAAMLADTGGDVDYLFDFHSWFGPWSDENFIFATPELVGGAYLSELETIEPLIDAVPSFGQPGMLRIWGMSADGLNAEHAYTVELGFHPGRNTDRLLEYGENFARALLGTLGPPKRCDLNVDGLCDVADVDLLTAQGNLVTGTPITDIKFDLDGNGILDSADITRWLAEAPQGQFPTYLAGDADLDGFVDGVDFLAWNTAKFTSGNVWSDGDFNGDGFVNGADFVIWNQFKFQSAQPSLVPEAMPRYWVALLYACCWSCRRVRSRLDLRNRCRAEAGRATH